MLNQVEYYRHPAVRKRIVKFVRNASYIVGYGESELWRGNPKGFYLSKLSGLRRMLDRGLDILICVQQKDSTLGLLDIEYYGLSDTCEFCQFLLRKPCLFSMKSNGWP